MKTSVSKRTGGGVLLPNTSFSSTDNFCFCRCAVAPKAVIFLCQNWTTQSKHGQDPSLKVTTHLAGTECGRQRGTQVV